MNYKIQGAIRRNRTNFIICAILWVFLTIVFVSPVSLSIFQAKQGAKLGNITIFQAIGENFMHPFVSFGKIFEQGAVGDFTSFLVGFTIFYLIFFFIGFVKSAPKNEYSDIEHGSSDWSQRGEQYEILNKNKGIILAENNYLPVDKRGNVNVLVVGRIRFW